MSLFHTILYLFLVGLNGATARLAAMAADPVCLVDLLLGAVYVTAVLVLIHRHRWMWVCYLALGGLHVAAALVQGGVHP